MSSVDNRTCANREFTTPFVSVPAVLLERPPRTTAEVELAGGLHLPGSGMKMKLIMCDREQMAADGDRHSSDG